jgi:hypothetical protein
MSDAEIRFSQALKRLNDERLKKSPPAQVKAVASVRVKLKNYCSDLVDVGYALTGGGTLWVNVSAGALVDIEEAVGRVTGLIKNDLPLTYVSKTKKELDKLERSVRARVKEPEFKSYYGDGASVLATIIRAKATYGEIVKIASKRPVGESNAYLNCCYKASVYLEKSGEG